MALGNSRGRNVGPLHDASLDNAVRLSTLGTAASSRSNQLTPLGSPSLEIHKTHARTMHAPHTHHTRTTHTYTHHTTCLMILHSRMCGSKPTVRIPTTTAHLEERVVRFALRRGGVGAASHPSMGHTPARAQCGRVLHTHRHPTHLPRQGVHACSNACTTKHKGDPPHDARLGPQWGVCPHLPPITHHRRR